MPAGSAGCRDGTRGGDFRSGYGRTSKNCGSRNEPDLLSGLKPGHDIRIEFTGVRPGEKLFEEINTEHEGLLETHHEKIRIFAGTNEAMA